VSTPIRIPAYRLHRPSGRAVVTLYGRDVYLGKYNSPESKAEYRRLIAELLANGGRSPAQTPDFTLNEILLAYLRFADGYYRKNDKPTKEPALLRLSVWWTPKTGPLDRGVFVKPLPHFNGGLGDDSRPNGPSPSGIGRGGSQVPYAFAGGRRGSDSNGEKIQRSSP
jgi:hypothetical protein